MTSLRCRAFRVYQRAPEKLKRTVGWIVRLLPERVRYGSEHVRWHKFVTESQYWSLERLRAYQLDQLRHSVTHAYEHVPFYRRLFDQHGIHPSDVKTLEDVRRLPIIDKGTVRENREAMVATNVTPAERIAVVPGGTSGSPLHYYWTPNMHALERAFVRVIWKWFGYRYGKPLLRRVLHWLNPRSWRRAWTRSISGAPG